MESRPSDPRIDPDQLDRVIRASLEADRRKLGWTIPQIVGVLSGLQPRAEGGSDRRQYWYEWQKRPQIIAARLLLASGLLSEQPWALALTAAADEAPVSAREMRSAARQAARLEQLEEEMTHQAEELAGVREDVAHIREDVAGLSQTVSTDLAGMRGLLNQLISEQRRGRGPRGKASDQLENAGS